MIEKINEAGKTVGVVILTYNRLSLLKITLCKVLKQTYDNIQILIVDNGSIDGTQEFLKEQQNIKTIFLSENSGPAGGFYEGIKYFTENTGVDYVWAMDDDFFPFPSCLEILVSSTNQETIVFPFVREKDFASRRQPGWWGVLIPIKVIKEVGYPKKELFFWSEDTEYLQHRMRDLHGYPSKWISQAKGVHFTKREKNFRSPWRYYYEIRNTTFSRLHIRERTVKRTFKLIRSWVKLFALILIKENNKVSKMRWFLLGSYHGITKQLGKKVDPQFFK